MEEPQASEKERERSARSVVDIAIRLAALAFLLYWSLNILAPFAELLMWSTIFAVSLYPVFISLGKKLGGSRAWSATLITLCLLIVMMVPAVWVMSVTANDILSFRERVNKEGLTISPPPEGVKNIPLIGRKLDALWNEASLNEAQFAKQNNERIKSILLKILGLISSVAKGILLLAASIIVSGFLMYYGHQIGESVRKFITRLVGHDGDSMASIMEVTIRNVTRGILGVAAFQSLLGGIGMVVGGVPLAGLWTLLWLILAIVQVPALPVALGVIIWVWQSDTSTGMAIILTIWMLVAGLIDNVLKPIMLGKGAPVPMLVVFLGAIGGFIFTGFTGLFTGAMVLSLGYILLVEWIGDAPVSEVSSAKIPEG